MHPDQPPAAGQSQTPAAAAAPVDYAALLSQIPDDFLNTDRRVASRVGNIAQRIADRERETIQAESRRKAQEETEARMHKLAEEDPFQFSAQYLKQHAESQAHKEIENLRKTEQEQLMYAVGQAYGNLPEWKDVMADPDNANRLANSVAGKQGADIVASFNATALDIIAEQRAKRAPNNDAEIEARVQERLAARLRGEAVPQMSTARTINTNMSAAIAQMSDAEFDRFYKSTFRV